MLRSKENSEHAYYEREREREINFAVTPLRKNVKEQQRTFSNGLDLPARKARDIADRLPLRRETNHSVLCPSVKPRSRSLLRLCLALRFARIGVA
jgi:hypothetical protein